LLPSLPVQVIRMLSARPTQDNVKMILHEWKRKELHRDVRIAIIQIAIRFLDVSRWRSVDPAFESQPVGILFSSFSGCVRLDAYSICATRSRVRVQTNPPTFFFFFSPNLSWFWCVLMRCTDARLPRRRVRLEDPRAGRVRFLYGPARLAACTV
jgi:hypothetical protein